MVDVVQLVRASDCGSECRGFESHLPPKITPASRKICRSSCFIPFQVILSFFQTFLFNLSPFLESKECKQAGKMAMEIVLAWL